jgi:hypothetical protein
MKVIQSNPTGFIHSRLLVAVALAVSPLACSGGAKQQKAEGEPSTISSPPPLVEMSKMPVTEAVPADAATAEQPPPEPEKPQRRPQPTFNNETEIATIVGENGAVMKLAGVAVLRVPDGALRGEGKNLRFAVVKLPAAKGAPPLIGQAFVLEPKLKSSGPPFELSLNVPPEASNVELIVVVPPDPKAKGPKKTEYQPVAPKSIDAAKKQALFELGELPGATIYLTAKQQPGAAPAGDAGAAAKPAPTTPAKPAAPGAPAKPGAAAVPKAPAADAGGPAKH